MTASRAILLALALAFGSSACRSGSSALSPQSTPSTRAAAGAVAATSQRDQWLQMFARAYFPGRSGQVFYVPHEGEFLVDKDPLYRFMHGSPWNYDAQIPLVFYGPAYIRRGTFADAAAQEDVAPTVARLLGVPPPATTSGRALEQALTSTRERPRAIVMLVLDGMRADYFQTYAELMPTLSRLHREGASFSNARVTSLPTATAVGHATLGTGTHPRIHGLVVNRLFNRITGASQEAFNQLDPGELMALTLADVWNIETNGRARIIGHGGAMRATAGLVGHGACLLNGRKVLAASYSARDGGWETNTTCYALSEALAKFSAQQYWQQSGGAWMGHDIAHPVRFRSSAVFQRFEGDSLVAMLETEPIGTDAITDLIFVNVKSTDYVSHAYGPQSNEMRETLVELDRQVARAIAVLQKKAPNEFVVVVSADHGMPGEPPAGRRRILLSEIVQALDKRFSPAPPSIIQFFTDAANAQIHLDTERLAALGVSLTDVAAFLESQFFAAAFTEEEVRQAQMKLSRP
jgi:hypothetical protein